MGVNTQVPAAEYQAWNDEKWSELDVNFQLGKLHLLIKMALQEDINWIQIIGIKSKNTVQLYWYKHTLALSCPSSPEVINLSSGDFSVLLHMADVTYVRVIMA